MKKLLLFCFMLLTFIVSSQTTLIYTQDFAATNPTGWTVINAGTGNNWSMVSTSGPYNGSYAMVYSYNSTQAANTWAFTQGVSMTAGKTYRVEFYQKVGSSLYTEKMKVTVGNAQTVASQTTTLLDLTALTSTTYANQVTSEYSCTVTGTYYFSFNCYSAKNKLTLHVDNVRIYETVPTAPTCASLSAPSNGATNVSLSQVISWAATSGATGYDVYFGTSPTPPLVSSNQAGTTYNPGTLSSNTTYYHKIVPRNSVGSATGCNTWSFTTLTVPVNDLCSAPTSLPCGTSSLAGTTVNATLKTAPGGGGYASNYGVWYTFTGDGGQTTVSATGNSFDLEMTIVYGTCATNTLVSSQDLAGGSGTETYTFTTTNSTVYYVYIAYWSSTGTASNTGTFTISRSCIAPCTTPTTAGTLTANVYSTTVNDAVTFTTTGNGGSITLFEWSYDNFTSVAGTTNNPANPYSLILNVQQSTVWFRTTSVSGTCPAGVTTPISVTLASAPAFVYGTSGGDYISNVTLNTINNNSTYDSPLGDSYQDFTSISTTLVKGSSYTISASSPITFASTPSGYAAWIDFNNNGVFEVSENIMQKAPATTQSQTFTVPSDAATALVKMRVLSRWNGTPTTDAYYATGYNWGEIEEYKINIQVALPIELLYLEAHLYGERNNLIAWKTASEHNSAYFNVVHSTDGETWKIIDTIEGSGNTSAPVEYQLIHYNVPATINYYQLKQYDFNGVCDTYGPVAINNTQSTKKVVKIVNAMGQEVPEYVPNLIKGMYFEIYDDGTSKKVMN